MASSATTRARLRASVFVAPWYEAADTDSHLEWAERLLTT
jgi:hypothetical protein